VVFSTRTNSYVVVGVVLSTTCLLQQKARYISLTGMAYGGVPSVWS